MSVVSESTRLFMQHAANPHQQVDRTAPCRPQIPPRLPLGKSAVTYSNSNSHLRSSRGAILEFASSIAHTWSDVPCVHIVWQQAGSMLQKCCPCAMLSVRNAVRTEVCRHAFTLNSLLTWFPGRARRASRHHT